MRNVGGLNDFSISSEVIERFDFLRDERREGPSKENHLFGVVELVNYEQYGFGLITVLWIGVQVAGEFFALLLRAFVNGFDEQLDFFQ